MPELDVVSLNLLLEEAVEHANKYLGAPKNKEYSFKVAAQENLRKARKMIDVYNKEITLEYRKRKLESKKEPKPTPSKAAETAPSAT